MDQGGEFKAAACYSTTWLMLMRLLCAAVEREGGDARFDLKLTVQRHVAVRKRVRNGCPTGPEKVRL